VGDVPLPEPPTPSGGSDPTGALPVPATGPTAPLPLPPPDRRIRKRLTDGEPACYRHPNRVGGRKCTRCGKDACPDCLSQASVGSHCADCAKAAKPAMSARAKDWQARQPAFVAYALIAVNVIAFVGLGAAYGIGDVLGGSSTEAHFRYALNEFFLDGSGGNLPFGLTTSGNEWYRLVTSGFVHFGIIHLAFNMYFLYILGNQMEPQLGRVRFLSIYFASLLGGSAGVLLIDQGGLTAGASGAVFGLLGAFAASLWQHGINPFSTQIGTLLLINLALTFFVGGISIGGHLGGLVAGAICGFVTMAPGHKAYSAWLRRATPLGVAVLAIGLSVLVVR